MKYRYRQAYAQKIPDVGCVRKHIGEELIVRGFVLVHIYIYGPTAAAASKLAEKYRKDEKNYGTTDVSNVRNGVTRLGTVSRSIIKNHIVLQQSIKTHKIKSRSHDPAASPM